MFTRPPDVPESDLDRDLRQRWLPSIEQMTLADQYMRAFGVRECFTVHLLLNKEYGFWTKDVVVEPVLEAVFGDRDSAEEALVKMVDARRANGETLTGGYSRHFNGRGDTASVWESIFTAGER